MKKIPIKEFMIERIYQDQKPLSVWQRLVAWFKNEVYTRREQLYHYDIQCIVGHKPEILDVVELDNGIKMYVTDTLPVPDVGGISFVVRLKSHVKTSVKLITQTPQYFVIKHSLYGIPRA